MKKKQLSSLKLMKELEKLTVKEFANESITNIRNSFGVDLSKIFLDTNLSTQEKIRKGQHDLMVAVFKKLDLEKSGDEKEKKNTDSGFLYALASDVETEPNVSFNPTDLPIILNYQRSEVISYLKTLTKRFELMTESNSAGQLAIQLVSSGLVGLGVPAGVAAGRALRAGKSARDAALAGVRGIGLKTAILIAIFVFVILVYFFFVNNPKKVLGLIINQTGDNLVVENWKKGVNGGNGTESNLYMESGEMINFMQDQESLASPKYQIKGGAFLDDPKEKLVFGGFYFADKKFGVFGSEGIMVFNSVESDLKFAHMFASPYNKDNGTNMIAIPGKTPDLEKLYDALFETREVNIFIKEEGCTLQSRVNDASGGIVGCIAAIST